MARKHDGTPTQGNLAPGCFRCNSHKGSNLSGTDPGTGRMERLFHPRADEWKTHFRWRGALLVGKTAIGRATIAVLNMNRPDLVTLRRALRAEVVRF